MSLSMNQLSAMNCHYARYSFEYYLDKVAENGLKNCEIWAAMPHMHVEDCDNALIQKCKKQLADRGLKAICYTPETVVYPVNIASPDQQIRQRSMAFEERAIEIASEVGIEKMLVTPGWGCLDQPREEALSWSMDSLAKLAKKAESCGVILALEHLSPISSNLMNTAADLKKAVDAIASPNFKAMLDTCQVGLVNETVQDYIDTLGDDLVHVHLVDGTPGGHLALGDGNLPLQQWVGMLDKAGYQGYLSMEIADRRYFMHPEEADRRSIAAFKSWIGA
ncbi:MAG: sugar phosphate isomerase/epimerase [Pygmaiobacter massiliensis]|nr:sugar phosphate isomerase/epimerase [Pygmaiobacter massiliensis]